jgi:spermidine/putrescine transport system ATP-binding protein
MEPPAVELLEMTRRFGRVIAVDAVTLAVPRGGFFSLLGPSGCGKTTLLRLVAGLEVADAGEIRLGGQPMTAVPAHLRPTNTVFQSYALFPHLDVQENVAFGLRVRRLGGAECRRRVDAMLELMQVTELARRRPGQLSGGQRQRVALARALVNEPEVLLLDEPLGALDLQLRRQLQGELRALQQRVGITFIHVTHDQEEALALSDRVAVMRAGRLEQVGAPAEVYERPRTRFVAGFVGESSLVEGRMDGVRGDDWLVRTDLGELKVRSVEGGRFRNGDSVTLAIRPERVRLRNVASGPVENGVEASVTGVTYGGAGRRYQLQTRGAALFAQVLNGSAEDLQWRVGDRVLAEIPPGALVMLED